MAAVHAPKVVRGGGTRRDARWGGGGAAHHRRAGAARRAHQLVGAAERVLFRHGFGDGRYLSRRLVRDGGRRLAGALRLPLQ